MKLRNEIEKYGCPPDKVAMAADAKIAEEKANEREESKEVALPKSKAKGKKTKAGSKTKKNATQFDILKACNVNEEEIRWANLKVARANSAAAAAEADDDDDDTTAVAAAAAIFNACEPMRKELTLRGERERVASDVAILAQQISTAQAATLNCDAAVAELRLRYARLLQIDVELRGLHQEDAEPPPPAAAP